MPFRKSYLTYFCAQNVIFISPEQKALIKKARDDISLTENLGGYRSPEQIFHRNDPLGAADKLVSDRLSINYFNEVEDTGSGGGGKLLPIHSLK